MKCGECRWFKKEGMREWHLCMKNLTCVHAGTVAQNDPSDGEVFVQLVGKLVVAGHSCASAEPHPL